ncbi:MAG: chemotaxis protein CheB, partial [Caldimonas sp.]
MDDTPTKEAAAAGSPEGPGTDPEEDRIVVLSTLDFPIVGIGASAGGLAALARFFEAMPARNGMAFVVVLHLSPSHESHASEILQRSTRMPVSQVRDSAPIEADHVYVIPPGQQLTLSDGHLQLTETERVKGRPVAIDIFFRTLAQVHRTRAVSIVLSGVGSDGAVGLADVKEHGGITIAQAPEDAEQDGMPRAAISTGLIDFVLPVVEMPQKLIDLWANARAIQLPADVADSVRAEPPASLDAAREAEKALQEIMALVQTRTRHDFRHYKRATILRRIERRLQVRSVPHLPAYRDQLHQDPSETRALLQDLLISVTNFFRDRLAFEALERDVLPTLVKELEPGEDLRAWTPGCATGEEAYSLAMLLHEALGVREPAAGFQIFATDIDERAIAIARKGAYPGAIVTDVAPVRLRAYFNAAGEQFQVKKQVRDHVLFASHNVLRDPPFSRLHLICCRNLLIYLDREAQARILETFRASLLPGGLLFLGSSESAEALPQAFTVVDKKHRIYRVNHSAARPRVPPLIEPAPALHRAGAATEERRKVRPVDLHARALERFSAPSVLVDADHNVLHVANGAGRYFEMGSGVPSHNLVANIAAPLRLELRTALLKVKLGDGGVEARRIRVDRPEGPVFVDLTVRTFKDDHTGAELTLVTFDEVPAVDDGALGRPAGVSHGGADAAIHLEAEIVRLKEQIQDVVEHADISTEELKSSNEELQAINEELRSATEELETSKEELQSTNEELVTVNYELAAKIEESGKAKDDLQNMIASIDIATIFIDGAMRIQRYTPRAAELFNLIAGDIGRSLLDITHKLDYDELAHDAEQAFKQLRTVEREVAGTDGRTFLARLLPYRTEGDRIEGAVLNFVDISALRDVERRLEVGEEALRVAAATTKDFAIMTLDEAGLVTTWNAGAVRIFGYSTAEIVGQPAAVIFTPEDRAAG